MTLRRIPNSSLVDGAKLDNLPASFGDMNKSTYDPTNKNTDAFSMDNMVETATKKILTSTERTILGNTSNTNSGDNATNTQYSGLVTNATHTGDVTGATALTIDKTAITGKTAVTAVGTDYVLISDTSDSGNLKKALASDLGGGGGTYNPVLAMIFF